MTDQAAIQKLEKIVERDYKTRFDFVRRDDDAPEPIKKPITKPEPRDYTIANFRLRQWARGYLMHDRREIVKDTGGNPSGSLGQQVRDNNEEKKIYDDVPFIEIDDSQYRRLNTVMLAMTPYNFMFLNRHYIDRAKFISKRVEAGITAKRAAELFLDKLKFTKNMYTLDLREAQEEFLLRGGF